MIIEIIVWIPELGAIFQKNTLLDEVNLFGCTGVLFQNYLTFSETDVSNKLPVSSNLKKLKSNFSDKELFNLALTHKSASKKNNERLEFLGDAIINFYVTQKLYENYADIQEGKLTRLRASLVSREFLNDLGLAIGLSKAVKLGKGESTENNSIVGNAFEAVVGAIFLDTGLEDTKQFLDTLYSEEFSKLKPLEDWKDSKSQLQEILQKQGLALPKYKVVDRGPKYNEDRFEINCTSPDLNISATGKGKSRKIAEQEAAKLLLEEHFHNEE